MIYLAVPYSKMPWYLRELYFNLSCEITAQVVNKGLMIFAPIVYTHPMAVNCKLPGDWAYWKAFDEHFLAFCDTIYVLRVPGWEDSIGVQAEIDYMTQRGKEVRYIDPEEFDIELPKIY